MAERVDGRRVRGDETRQRVLRLSSEVASLEGLNGLSLGQLSEQLGLSKSGVHALFGTKEELQLATVAEARRRFVNVVVAPVWNEPPGLSRLTALVASWLDYARRREFPGGCFVTHCSIEFSTQPGRVRDSLVTAKRDWLGQLASEIEVARSQGELAETADARQLAFEIDGLLAAGNNASLMDDGQALDRARRAVLNRLDELRKGGPARHEP